MSSTYVPGSSSNSGSNPPSWLTQGNQQGALAGALAEEAIAKHAFDTASRKVADLKIETQAKEAAYDENKNKEATLHDRINKVKQAINQMKGKSPGKGGKAALQKHEEDLLKLEGDLERQSKYTDQLKKQLSRAQFLLETMTETEADLKVEADTKTALSNSILPSTPTTTTTTTTTTTATTTTASLHANLAAHPSTASPGMSPIVSNTNQANFNTPNLNSSNVQNLTNSNNPFNSNNPTVATQQAQKAEAAKQFLAFKGLSVGHTLSKNAQHKLNSYKKSLLVPGITTLESKTDERLFITWKNQVMSLLQNVGLHAFTLLGGVETPQSESEAKNTILWARGTELYSHVVTMAEEGVEVNCNDSMSKDDATVVYIGVLETYGHEELVYNALKDSLGTVYTSLKPLKFFHGALRHLYYAVTHEFQRPNAVVIHNRLSEFMNKNTYKINENSDPRDTIKAIELEASILNNLHESVTITDSQKLIALRNAAFDNIIYTQAIKTLESRESSSIPNFNDLVTVIQNEYLNYVKEQPTTRNESANVASATDGHQEYDHKSEAAYPNSVHSDEHANWVDVPKGVCYQYAINGRCDRESCDYKHVKIEPNKNSEDMNNRSPHNSGNSRDKRTKFSSRFTPKAQSFKHKDVHQRRARKKEFLANFVSALADTLEESQSDSTTTEESSDSDHSDSDKKDTNAFMSALQATLAKAKDRKKSRKPDKGFTKDHPNRKKYLEKVVEMMKKEDKGKSKKANKTHPKKRSFSANLATLLSSRKVQMALGDTSGSDSGESDE